MIRTKLNIIVVFLLFAVSCKVLPTKPFLAKPAKIEFTAESKLSKEEKNALRGRLLQQQDDSTKVVIKDKFFIIHTLVNPIVYDTTYSRISARNMEASLHHLGYYKAKVTDIADSNITKPYKFNIFRRYKKVTEVSLKYIVNVGVITRIDTFAYRLKKEELQQIAITSKDKSFIKKDSAVTKFAILSEIARLVDSFRNNGYYKFTASELRMRGDSSIDALTNISDDPFEQLEALIEAQKKKDSPTIKLALVIIKPQDSSKLNKYSINKIYVLSDFRQGDNVSDLSRFNTINTKDFKHLYHQKLFKTSLITRNLALHSGDIYRQNDFYTTINNLTKLGVWQNVNIRLVENLDEINKLDIIIELTPAKKLTPSLSLDINYSAAGSNNNGIAGNLFGTSLNFSIDNKNLAKEAIKMSHNFRFGIEFRNKNRSIGNNPIQSNELSYTNDVSIPKLLIPKLFGVKLDPRLLFYKLTTPKTALQKYRNEKGETFINTNFSYSNRLDLFKLQNVGLSYGYRSKDAKNNIFTFKYLNTQFSNLSNVSDTFRKLLEANPFLKYSYNTSFAIGMAASYSTNKILKGIKNKNNIREFSTKFSGEESGKTWGNLPFFKKFKDDYLRKFVKLDAELKYSVTNSKNISLNTRFAIGYGIPLGNDEALPFFKQFAGGGSSSMRGWPIRGVGRGAQPLAPYTTSSIFNDRTGDIQIELNVEVRHPITKIIKDFFSLKGAAFLDIGNIWNFKESYTAGISNKTQFQLKNLGKEIGASAGYGLRFDFTYLVVRTDFGFRIKRPETSDVNYGFKIPDISFNDILPKIFSGKYREWRYENFNWTVGINYPF